MSATTTTDMLLVPMRLDVMQMNQQFDAQTKFFRFQMDYTQLATFGSPEPVPFNNNNYTPPQVGIHLHWTLPEGLRQGTRSENDTAFPLLPNRWLVARQQSNPGGAPLVKAWVIESDTEVQNGSPYYDGTRAQNKVFSIGQVIPCTPTMGKLTDQSALFLKAVSPGSATFAAYAPGVQNVLSFVDDVTDAGGSAITSGTFTYAVMGWYSDATFDPLNDPSYAWVKNTALDGSWVKQNSAGQALLDWYVFTDSAANLPSQTLLTAQVSGVVWNATQDYVPPANYPTDIPGTVRVAVGNTAIEALSALVVANGGTQAEADLLAAFQYGQMGAFDQPGSADVLNAAIRSHWFGASSGGTRWTVVAPGGNGMTSANPSTPPPVTPAQQTALAACNATQAHVDKQQRVLESLQWELYGMWWKSSYDQSGAFPPVPVPSGWNQAQFSSQLAKHAGLDPNISASDCATGRNAQLLFCQVIAQQTLVADLLSKLQGDFNTLNTSLDPTSQVLKGVQLPAFNSANDPVIVVSGLGRATNFDPVGSLLCRVPEQTLSALAVSGTTYSNKGAGTDISASLPTLNVPAGILPPTLSTVLTESFFLSPWMFAADVLKDATKADAVAAAIAAASPTSAPNWTPGNAASFGPIASSALIWVQPWVPLLLDWEVTVIEAPSYTPGPNGEMYTFDTKNWSFNGTDFTWNGTRKAGDGNFDAVDAQMILSGRTFITPHLSNNLAGQIDTFLKNNQERNPDLVSGLKELEDKLTAIASQDLLSQRLSGMLAGMVERSHTGVPAPDAATQKRVVNLQHGHPAPYPQAKPTDVPIRFDFAPMGGTFFIFNKLQVTDSFGRAIDLMLANGNTLGQSSPDTEQESFYPIISDEMQPTGFTPGKGGISTDATQRMVQLAPRMVQDSRLTFTLLSNDGHDSDIYQTAGANPVCGWLVANHLDRSLAAYATDGTALGELYLSQGVNKTYTAEWQPDPTSPSAPQTVAAIPNTFLAGVLQSLVTETLKDNGVSFDGFLKSIDATLWTIDPLGQRKDQDLSVLVGRPLAVVRAQAMLNYRGLAYTMQDWDMTFQGSGAADPAPLTQETGGVFDQTWPVLLGSQALRNDGLIGYFLDTATDVNWSVFNAVNIPGDATATNYLKSITPDTCLQLAFTDDSMTPTVAASQLAKLTMLMDPRGSVHAFTGLLPVASLELPSQFVTQALKTLSYVFRVGPFLTSPNAVRLPRPAERKGTWTWFDETIKTTVPVQQSDSRARMTTIPPLIKEGWLKLTPNPPHTPPKK